MKYTTFIFILAILFGCNNSGDHRDAMHRVSTDKLTDLVNPLMYPELNAQIMEGLANTYKESGWVPEWASPGHRSCMIGSNSASLIADSYLKGIRGYDIETLYEAILKNTEEWNEQITSVGRFGADYYKR